MSVTQSLDATALEKLRTDFRGQLILPGDREYDSSRVVWNAIADRRPALIARCTRVEDVVAAIRFAREQDLVIAVRGGGHSVAGFSTCDGGVVIDLSGMRAVQVDPAKRTARVEGGALLEQLDRAAQEYGLACPVGVVGHTGVAGLTLGGGMGRLQRKHGFTIDNLLSVDLVTVDGALRHVSDETDPELFWGLRGAGANFGIATAFEFRLHPVGPNVTTAVVVFPIERAREAAALYRELYQSVPDYMHLGLGFGTAPEGRGATVAVAAAHFGAPQDAERDLRGLRGQIEPLAETVTPTTYLGLQTMGDEEMAWGKRFYMKGAFPGRALRRRGGRGGETNLERRGCVLDHRLGDGRGHRQRRRGRNGLHRSQRGALAGRRRALGREGAGPKSHRVGPRDAGRFEAVRESRQLRERLRRGGSRRRSRDLRRQ